MIESEIKKFSTKYLTEEQRDSYFNNGYIFLENIITSDSLEKLNEVKNDLIVKSTQLTTSDDIYDIAPEHSKNKPAVRRLKSPDIINEVFWEFANDLIADIASDLVGPNVVFHHSKLNFKWKSGNDDVSWHQDIQFYPHTNYSPLAIGCYLEDTNLEDGPVSVIPGSHKGPLYNQYDKKGKWTGSINPEDLDNSATNTAVSLPGPAGSITVHNCRTVHGSPPSVSIKPRPLLINAFSSSDAFPYTYNASFGKNYRTIVRGEEAKWAHHDPRPCLIPPDWSQGYTSIFAAQSGEK